MANFEKYYLGLDLGTSSVGWALTDENYNVLKKNGKALWGVRLFDEASTKQERRMHRTARRLTQRRAMRIDLLQELFAQSICEKDAGFFQRLNESRYYPEDKTMQQKYSIFCDKDFNDKDYHKVYPTIYHLRKALMDGTKQFDVRLVYLAIHHIMKHRGHFLFENFEVNQDGISGLDETYDAFCAACNEHLDISIPADKKSALKETLTDKKLGITAKSKQLQEIWNFSKDKQPTALTKLVAGGTAALDELFADETFKDSDNNKICFANANYEEKESAIETELGDSFDVIATAKALYDWSLLADLMGDYKSLSEAKIALYDKHEHDLKILKRLLKQDGKLYNAVFKTAGKDNYSAYVGLCMQQHKKIAIDKKCSAEDFYKFVGKTIDNLPDSKEKQYIKDEIATGTLLPKAVTKINGVIPYQLHQFELEKILANAAKYLPFLNSKDKYGTVADKILCMFKFRIPYYVGPLNEHSPYAWIVKKDHVGKILPWNFDEKVDTEATGEKFIRNMTNKCTYLLAKDVLPKYSLLYSEYTVLNELNNLRVGRSDEKISVELKQKIFEKLFLKYPKVTAKKLITFLVSEGIPKEDAEQISGIDGDFKSSMKPWIDMSHILGETFSKELAEGIITDITLFGSDRKVLSQRLKSKYSQLTAEQIKLLSKLPYHKWGRLSRELLTETLPIQGQDIVELVDKSTGETMSLITALRKTNYNFMQLLSSEFGYMAAISAENGALSNNEKLTYEALDELAMSPSVKRPLWQTLKIIRELHKIAGGNPDRIFIEMARGEDKNKKRTKSRRERLIELYKSCKEDGKKWAEELQELTDEQLRSDKLYLYYTQMGKSMYTGETININQLFDANVYDIDHIYPRSVTGDDSLNNRVLVERHVNAYKNNDYPLTEKCRTQMLGLWKNLLDKELISKEKYKRLTRNNALTADEKADFVGRQLVETRQSTKLVAEILKELMPETQIIYSKAGNVSAFRQYADIIKVRELNDYHHAKDAYLNIVVGNAFYTKFTANPRNFFTQKNSTYTLNEDAFYGQKIERNGQVAWIPGENGTKATVLKWMGKNNILFTRMTHQNAGGGTLFDQMLMKKGKGQVPIKATSAINNIDKYGGYNKATTAYFMCAEVTEKGKKQRVIEAVPLHLANTLRTIDAKECYLSSLGYENPRVVVPNILILSLIKIDGFLGHISARTGKQYILWNAQQLCISDAEAKILKNILKFVERQKTNKNAIVDVTHDGINDENTKQLYSVFLEKLRDTVYNVKLSAQARTLTQKNAEFAALSLENRCILLSQILRYFQCNAQKTDLTLIASGAQAGTLYLSGKIQNKSSVVIVNQSITGFFETYMQLAPYEQ